jgi:hypothetical protein
LLIHSKNSQFHTLSIIIITKGVLLSYDSDESTVVAKCLLLGYGIIAILQMVVFIMTLFCCHKFFSSFFARDDEQYFSLALMLLRGGRARYCNILALSSLVNNQNETNRLGSFRYMLEWRFGKGKTGD